MLCYQQFTPKTKSLLKYCDHLYISAEELIYENRKIHRSYNNDKIPSTVLCEADNVLIQKKNKNQPLNSVNPTPQLILPLQYYKWDLTFFFILHFFGKIENSSLRILTENISKWNVIYLSLLLGAITKEDIHRGSMSTDIIQVKKIWFVIEYIFFNCW